MTRAAEALHPDPPPSEPARAKDQTRARLVHTARDHRTDRPDQPGTSGQTDPARQDRTGHGQALRTWPLLVLALPAAVAVWSGGPASAS